jgi:uncharacterized protein (DUF2237 family)
MWPALPRLACALVVSAGPVVAAGVSPRTARADEPAACAPSPSAAAAPVCLGLGASVDPPGHTNPSQRPNPSSPASGSPSIIGAPLQVCSPAPRTGFDRSGRCETGPDDVGVHVVCAELTEAFLRFTRARGNDLSTPRPEFGFPGLRPGDRWCLCASRWAEADAAGIAPPVVLAATHAAATRHVPRARLEARALAAAAPSAPPSSYSLPAP